MQTYRRIQKYKPIFTFSWATGRGWLCYFHMRGQLRDLWYTRITLYMAHDVARIQSKPHKPSCVCLWVISTKSICETWVPPVPPIMLKPGCRCSACCLGGKKSSTNKEQRSLFQFNLTVHVRMCQEPVYAYGVGCLSCCLSSTEPFLSSPSPHQTCALFCLCLSVKLNFKEAHRCTPWPLVIGKTLYTFLFASKYTVFGIFPNPYISLTSSWLCVALPWSDFDGRWLFPFAQSQVFVCWHREVIWATGIFIFIMFVVRHETAPINSDLHCMPFPVYSLESCIMKFCGKKGNLISP